MYFETMKPNVTSELHKTDQGFFQLQQIVKPLTKITLFSPGPFFNATSKILYKFFLRILKY